MKRPLIALAALFGFTVPAQAQEVWTRTNDATDHLGHPSTLYRQDGVAVDRQHPGSAELLVHCHISSEDLGEVTEVAVIIHESQEVESTVGDLMVKRIDDRTRTLPIFWLDAGDSHIMAVVHEGHGDSRNTSTSFASATTSSSMRPRSTARCCSTDSASEHSPPRAASRTASAPRSGRWRATH